MQTLRLLLWLKWKLLFRGYRRNTSLLVSVLLLLLLFFPIAVGIAVVCGMGFLNLEPPSDGHLLRIALFGIYLLWLLSPLFGYAFNDSYDITRLFVYPISMRQIFLGAVLGSLLDMTTLLLLPTLLAAVIGFTNDPLSAILNLLAVGLFVLHTFSLSQMIILLSAGILRSRRFRDSAAMIFFAVWAVYYILSQSLAREALHINWRALLDSPAWEALNFLPHGLAARAMAAAQDGDFTVSFGFLLALGGITAGTLLLASQIVQKVYTGDLTRAPATPTKETPTAPAPRPAPAPETTVGRPNFVLQRLSPVVRAMVEKEVRYLFRDPYFRLQLTNLAFTILVAVFVFVNPTHFVFGSWRVWGASSMLLLTEMGLVCNLFGTEGGAIHTLFLFPCSRREILLGKNLTLFAALSVVNLLYTGIVLAFAQVWSELGLLYLWTELALVTLIAIGNVTSLYFPYRIVMRGWRVRQQSASKGCGYSLLYMVIMFGALIILLPVVAAFFVPHYQESNGWLALSLPLAALYVGGLYALSLYLAEPLLRQREQSIGEVVSREEE